MKISKGVSVCVYVRGGGGYKLFSTTGRKKGNVLFNDALNTFNYGYMASDISLRTILIVREETRCRHIGYSYQLTARVLLYAPSHRQDSTYHGLCYTSRGALAVRRNSTMGPPHEGLNRRPNALTTELHLAPLNKRVAQWYTSLKNK